MNKVALIFWFNFYVFIGCGRYEVVTSTSTSTEKEISRTVHNNNEEDEEVIEPTPVSGSVSTTPTQDTEVDVSVSVSVKVDVKVLTKVINGKQYSEDQQLNYYVIPQHKCISLNRFDKKGRQLYSTWSGENTVRLYTDNSCWPYNDDVLVKRDESLIVCQKNLLGYNICNLLWLIEINPNSSEKTIREYLDNVK